MPTKPTGRPRGRPPGVKNKPKSIEDFVLSTIAEPPKAPPKLKRWPAGPMLNMSPEERTAYSLKMAAARSRPTNQTPGKPRDFTNAQWAEVQATARLDAKRIMKKMKDSGQLPDDPRAVEALEKAVTTLKASTAPKDVAALARLVLDFTKAKPAQKVDHTVRTAEDILDEMAEDGE